VQIQVVFPDLATLNAMTFSSSGRQLSESTAGTWRTVYTQRMADTSGVDVQYVSIASEQAVSSGYEVVFEITPPPGVTAESIQSTITNTVAASGTGGFDSFFSNLFEVTVTGASLTTTSLLSPPPAAPPPSSPGGGGLETWHAIYIVMVLLVMSFVLLAFVAIRVLDRRKRRTDQVTVIPEVGERAVVQPPSLPAEAPPPPLNDRVPLAAPTSSASS